MAMQKHCTVWQRGVRKVKIKKNIIKIIIKQNKITYSDPDFTGTGRWGGGGYIRVGLQKLRQ